jgi:alpha-galactosidase
MNDTLVSLRAAGSQLLLDTAGDGLPRVLHWGPDLGPLTDADLAGLHLLWDQPVPRSALDQPGVLTLLPDEQDGWSGTPGFAGHRAGADSVATWSGVQVDAQLDGGGGQDGGAVSVAATSVGAALRLAIVLRLDRHGVLRVQSSVTSLGEPAGDPAYDVAALRALLPLPPRASEVLDLTGRWCRERSPQRRSLGQGTHLRASRRGRTGHDATLLLIAGTPGFTTRRGEVWGAHVAWSGDHEHLVERLPEGAALHAGIIGGGELLRPGEVRLGPGETYDAPEVFFVWSDRGIDGLSARLHEHLRARPSHPAGPRPLVLNTWEACYFDLDLDRMRALADTAATVGVERFVIDDGWFRGRRDDSAGLGDWFVDEERWPEGLHPITNHVRALGMQVGLWVEPEMANLDSDLVRAHPSWLLDVDLDADLDRDLDADLDANLAAPEWRRQHVLDLAQPEVSAYLLERLDALVTEYDLDFLKWDHNRDLHVARHLSHGRRVPGVHVQTLAVYALLDELRRRHPALEIESCSSGGARVDLGILGRTDRVWASDTNDAIERQQIQFWTANLLPPELVGSHVGPGRAHTTGRVLDLPFRLATSLFGHAGIEWDLTQCEPDELDQIRAWAALYRRLRPLLHSGEVARADATDDGTMLHGVVARDHSEAVFCFARTSTSPSALPGRWALPGLAPDVTYRVELVHPALADAVAEVGRVDELPGWLSGSAVARGALLGAAGLALPILDPGQAVVVQLQAVPAGPEAAGSKP